MKKTVFCSDSPLLVVQSGCHNRIPDNQCDCACTVPGWSAQEGVQVTLPHRHLVLADPCHVFPIDSGHYVLLHEHTGNIVALNSSALALVHHFTHPRLLSDVPSDWRSSWGELSIQSVIDQLFTIGLLVSEGSVRSVRSEITESASDLVAWIHVTDQCNLRCSYCYLPHVREHMSVSTGLAAIKATVHSALAYGHRRVKFKYGGGEPLLQFPLITQLHKHGSALAAHYSLEMDGVVLSNGTLLTAAIIEEMQHLGIRLMVSLDGLGDLHDRQRVYADGRGTFEHVRRGIETALQLGLAPDISITVTGRTAQGLSELMDWVLEHDLPFSLNFYRENALSASHADLRLEEEQIVRGMFATFKVIEANLPRRSILASVLDRANLAAPHLRTCAVGHNYLVFDQRGRVSKCQMNMGHSVATVDAEDPLSLVHSDKIGIQNLSVDEKEGCKSCEWKYWCTGGCPLATFRATGRYDVKSPNCEIYKAMLPEALRLEGLRLLKYFGDTQGGSADLEP